MRIKNNKKMKKKGRAINNKNRGKME